MVAAMGAMVFSLAFLLFSEGQLVQVKTCYCHTLDSHQLVRVPSCNNE